MRFPVGRERSHIHRLPLSFVEAIISKNETTVYASTIERLRLIHQFYMIKEEFSLQAETMCQCPLGLIPHFGVRTIFGPNVERC